MRARVVSSGLPPALRGERPEDSLRRERMDTTKTGPTPEHAGGEPQGPPPGTRSGHRRRRPLSPKQQIAIELKAGGMSITDIANRLDVHRVTVSDWFNENDLVIAEVNNRLQDILAEDRDLIPVLMHKAFFAVL